MKNSSVFFGRQFLSTEQKATAIDSQNSLSLEFTSHREITYVQRAALILLQPTLSLSLNFPPPPTCLFILLSRRECFITISERSKANGAALQLDYRATQLKETVNSPTTLDLLPSGAIKGPSMRHNKSAAPPEIEEKKEKKKKQSKRNRLMASIKSHRRDSNSNEIKKEEEGKRRKWK